MNRHRSVPWAVYLGCTTPHRLAREWRIPKRAAAALLKQSREDGELISLDDGYAPVLESLEPIGTWPGLRKFRK